LKNKLISIMMKLIRQIQSCFVGVFMKKFGVVFLLLLIIVVIGIGVLIEQRATKPAVVATSSSFSTPSTLNTATGLPPTLPPIAITESQTKQPVVLPAEDEASARLTVPPGFAIRIFADGLTGTPRFMTISPEGDLYVSLYRSGEIARLPDRNQDGIADSVEIIASGLSNPHGVEFHDGWLYVAEINRVTRLKDADGDGVFEISELVTDNIPGGGGHTSRTLHFGPDGKLYVSAGSSCNVCAESDPRRAAILRFNPDGSIPGDNPFAGASDVRLQPVFAWGLRNSVDFLWTPTGQLWADHNGRDNLMDQNGTPDTLPPEEIIIAVQGNKSHGWPYCYTALLGANLSGDAEVADTQNGLKVPQGFDCSLSNVVPALFTDLAHSAPLGMALGNTALAFPVEYQNSLYVAYHGSWNTSAASIRDCKVERIVLNGEIPVSSETFVNGWRAAGETCGSGSTWGRPADVVVGADGALYISDDKGNRIYRVVFTGE
jgi:glucose/arabinose dehydrogenase